MKDPKIDSRDGKEIGKDSGRKVWKDKEDRWQHDRFQETEQAPKSREELLMVYGYDIRNEEAPPKARRRRRYGWVLLFLHSVKVEVYQVYLITDYFSILSVVVLISTLAVGRMKRLTVGL